MELCFCKSHRAVKSKSPEIAAAACCNEGPSVEGLVNWRRHHRAYLVPLAGVVASHAIGTAPSSVLASSTVTTNASSSMPSTVPPAVPAAVSSTAHMMTPATVPRIVPSTYPVLTTPRLSYLARSTQHAARDTKHPAACILNSVPAERQTAHVVLEPQTRHQCRISLYTHV